jgi:predicted DCC family thiol-disulfide oxidoreductase YuxK
LQRLRQLSAAFANSDGASHIQAMTNPRVTIWFDGDCPLCVAEISLIRRLDAKKGRLAFVDLTGDGTCPLDRAEMLAKFHAQEAGREILVGAAAFGAMWRQVTPFQPLGWLTLFPPALWLLNILYVQFLRVRPRLQAWMRVRQKSA